MTRKEELEHRAINLAGAHYECEDPWYSCPLSPDGCADDGKGPICTCGAMKRKDDIYQALLRVEREVLKRVDTRYHYHDYLTDFRMFSEWLEAQQKELG